MMDSSIHSLFMGRITTAGHKIAILHKDGSMMQRDEYGTDMHNT